MTLDRLFAQSDLMGIAMQAAVIKNDVFSHNIANVDTPGFSKSVVAFEDSLKAVLEKADQNGDINLSDIRVKVGTASGTYRIDKNGVDIESEMIALNKNSFRYDTLASAVMHNKKSLSTVLSGRQG